MGQRLAVNSLGLREPSLKREDVRKVVAGFGSLGMLFAQGFLVNSECLAQVGLGLGVLSQDDQVTGEVLVRSGRDGIIPARGLKPHG